ncbi:ATPase, partial [Streptomyces panaciradicis]|nr:ATPase [Streptomyces panaciradicis]
MSSDLNQALGEAAPRPGPAGPSDGARALVVGLDAGGTRTRAVLADAADGRALGEGAAGPGNALTVPLPRLT